jgi:hypothetical protein
LTFALLVAATPLAAQQDSLMREAVRLATEGQSDSARAIVESQLARLSSDDALYPEVLFTAGMVSDTARVAAQYFRRVSIEYSRSPWADMALLRLAQLAFAAGDLEDVKRYTQRVLLDYPLSPVRGQAAFWAGRAEFDLDNPVDACHQMDEAERNTGDNIELANQVAFYLQRCTGVLSAGANAADTAATDEGNRSGDTVYAVQVAAVSSAAAADQAMQALRAAGHPARVFKDADGLLKIRVGRFRRRQDAEALVPQLRRVIGGSPFVVEERQ